MIDRCQLNNTFRGCWVAIVALGFLWSCGENSPKIGRLSDVVWADSLVVAVQELKGSPEAKGQCPVQLYNNLLIAVTYPSEPFIFNVLSVEGDSIRCIGSLIRRGRGPMEAAGAKAVVDQSCGMLYLGADMGTAAIAKLFAVDITKPIDQLFDSKNIHILPYPGKNYSCNLSPAAPNRFLTIGFSESGNPFGSCSLYDSVVRGVEFAWPSLDGNERVEGFLKSEAFKGTISKQWGTNRYVYSSDYGNYVLLFDFDGSEIHTVHTLFDLLPKFTVLDDGMNVRFQRPYGLSIYTTGKYLYLKYLEHPSLGKPWRMDNELFVFDWNGLPVRKIVLDVDINSFVVSQDDKVVYGLSVDPQSAEKVLVRAQIDT